jgi:multidrug efflux pump subunit AcrA (membrane-fusion protein)
MIPDHESASGASSLVYSPLRHAGAVVGILETIHPATGGSLSSTIYQFFAALSEITADFLSQQELQQLRLAKTTWQQWDQFQLRLGQSPDLASVCSTIANDGRLIIGCDRIVVLPLCGRRYLVESISGVERPDPRAGCVQSLEALAWQVANEGKSVWTSEASDAASSRIGPVLERHRRESGAACVGMIPIQPAEHSGEPIPAVLVFERFEPDPHWATLQQPAELLAQRSTFALRAAVERSEIPWLGLWLGLRSVRRLIRRPGLLIAAAVLAVIAVALVVIPSEFRVTGSGELWPSVRRDVFASTSGIVDQILVNHGEDVKPNQPLVVLRDPALDQELPKIAGEIATINERLKAVQFARLTGTSLPDAQLRARQLTAEEEELKAKLDSLERQRAVVEERRSNLTLKSPIAGQVLTWDLTQHLSARPVERGQSLLTIGDTNGPWIVEVHIADKDAGHVLRARKSHDSDLNVEFILPSEPGRVYRGRMREIALAAEATDRSSGQVRVVVTFDRNDVPQLRPGATAIPRIHCGRHSIGYVWLHDLIDTIRIRLLF